MIIEGQVISWQRAAREAGIRLLIAMLAFAAGVLLAPAVLP